MSDERETVMVQQAELMEVSVLKSTSTDELEIGVTYAESDSGTIVEISFKPEAATKLALDLITALGVAGDDFAARISRVIVQEMRDVEGDQ